MSTQHKKILEIKPISFKKIQAKDVTIVLSYYNNRLHSIILQLLETNDINLIVDHAICVSQTESQIHKKQQQIKNK